MDRHSTSFEEFDLTVTVDEEGEVRVGFDLPGPTEHLAMTWDDLREVIEFVGKHGLDMHQPMFVEFSETRESIPKGGMATIS